MPRLSDIGLEHLAFLDIGVLQFSPRVDGQLRGHGLVRIGHFDSQALEYSNIPFHLDEMVIDRLERVAKHTDNVCTSWHKVWSDDPKGPYTFSYSTGPARFCQNCLSRSLHDLRAKHGRLLNIPLREGYGNVDELVGALEHATSLPSGFGRKKMLNLAEVLEKELRICVRDHDRADEGPTAGSAKTKAENRDGSRNALRSALSEVPMEALGLGAKTKHLYKAGWESVGDLPASFSQEIHWIPSLGRKTANRAVRSVESLVSAFDGKTISRETFARLENIPVIPGSSVLSQTSLPDRFRATLLEAAAHDDNPVTETVVAARVCQSGSKTATLGEIGARNDVSLTRERVRQIEMRFLRRVRRALLDPWDRRLGAYFSDDFSSPFTTLVYKLGELDEVGIEEMVGSIEAAWGCSRKNANLLLPMVAAIVEGSARTSGELRRLGDLPDILLQPIRRPARDWPAWNLGAGKTITRRLNKAGIKTAEDLRRAWIDGFDLEGETQALLSGLEYLASVPKGHRPDTDDLAHAVRRRVLPEDGNTFADFLENIGSDLCDLIKCGEFYVRSVDVFRRRSIVPPEERETTQVLADEYGISQPTVSRTQTVTHERLYEILLEENAGFSRAILRPEWISFWHKAYLTFERFPDDQKTFQRSLVTEFGSLEEIVGAAAHPIWAILSGRTTTQSFGQIATGTPTIDRNAAPIVLRGFRQFH